MLRVHLTPTFGERRLPDISCEVIQTLLAAKLRDGFAWETVHHIRCALSKVLGTAEGFHSSQRASVERMMKESGVWSTPILFPVALL